MATKRFVVVEGNTPGKPACKRTVAGASRRSLFHTEPEKRSCKGNDWTEKEESALVQYLCLFWEDAYTNRWPTTKNMDFWDSCAEAVNSTCNSTRTGVSCIFLSLICMIPYICMLRAFLLKKTGAR